MIAVLAQRRIDRNNRNRNCYVLLEGGQFMKVFHQNRMLSKRIVAVFLAACTGLFPSVCMSGFPAAADTGSTSSGSSLTDAASTDSPAIAPIYDEAFYALLDYYGNITEGSVVKSYHTNGNTKITDYGVYNEVINLTDDREPQVSDGAVTFDLSGDTPERFYFEGKTTQPFEDLPWNISISYRLNGVPTPADQLAGKTGLVEINMDVVPNPSASEYNRNNLVLAATAIFNADDILSLEAEGAQVQLIGNLRSVLYLVLPGEEQHFTIRVGSNDFSFSGMYFVAVPATLAQLDQIADLKDARDKIDDSYHAICDSLDVILDTLDGMSGSLSTAANGLDKLNSARGTVSAGKGNVYAKADQALDSLGSLTDALAPAASHLATASNALTDVTNALTDLTQNAVALKPELENTRSIILKLQSDMENIRSLAADVESYNNPAYNIAASLQNDLEDLGDDLHDLESSLSKLEKSLASISGISKVNPISVGGMTSAEKVKKAVQQAQNAHDQYLELLALKGLTEEALPFNIFLTQYGGKSDAEAEGIIALLEAANDQNFEEKLEQMETANNIITTVNKTIEEVNNLVYRITDPTADVVDDLSSLCDSLGNSGISGDLRHMSKVASDLLADLNDHKGELADLTKHLDELGDLAIRVSNNADNALDLIQKLDDTINAYVPDAQQALSDASDLSTALEKSLQDMNGFLSSAESLLRSSGGDLDEGTKQVLSSLAEALRKSSAGLNETDTIRNAKDTVTSLIEDEWEKYAGGENNLLMMDAKAQPVSLTSSKNGAPSSIQYIMRTQEIKEEDSNDEETVSTSGTNNGNFWTRVINMFRDIWNAIVGIFRRDK